MRRLLVFALLLALSLAQAADADPNRRRGSGRGKPSQPISSVVTSLVLALLGYGQSNSVGSSGGALPVSVTNGSPGAPPYNNTEVRTATFVPNYSDTGAANTEMFGYGMADQLAFMSLSGGAPTTFIAFQTGGVGSQSYVQLQDGTGNWTNEWAEADALRSGFATEYPLAPTAPTPVFVWIQGETDHALNVTREQRVLDQLDLWQDVCDELQTAPWNLSAAQCPPIYLVTFGGLTRLGRGSTPNSDVSEVALADYELCRDYPARFVCAHPGYASTYTANNEHYSAIGHRENGTGLALAVHRRVVLGQNWRFFRPEESAITCVGNTVTIPLTGGTGSQIVIDTTNVARRPWLGFEYYDTQATMPSIITATVSSAAGTAILTLDRNCIPGAGARVRYAYSGSPDCSGGRTSQCGNGGNVRRAGCVPAYHGFLAQCDWLWPFDVAIPTVSGSASPNATFSRAGLGNRANGVTAWATTRSSTVTNSVADITVSVWAWVTGFAANQVLIEKWQGTTARNFSIRHNTTGRVEVFLSGNGTSLSYSCTSNNSVVTANTWHHIAFTKIGTAFQLYVNGAAIACASTTGSVPATMSNGVWAGTAIGGSNTGGNNLPGLVAHAAVWGMGLAPSRIAALYTSTPVPLSTDVRSQNPSHYWPLQGTGIDLGLAAPNPLLPYNTLNQIVELGTVFGGSDTLATFATTDLIDGDTTFTARLDFVANTPAQAGTFLDKDTAGSNERQLHLGFTTSRQIVVRIASSLTEGGGEWPSDGTRDECVTGSLTAGTRYRAVIVYNGAGAANADRVQVWTAPITDATGGDGRTIATLGVVTQQTCTFLGTIPASLTDPTTAAWTVGRRASGSASAGLRSVQLSGNAIVLWAAAATAGAQVSELLGAIDPELTTLGAPAAVFRALGPAISEVITQGAGTLSGAALGTAYVTPLTVTPL